MATRSLISIIKRKNKNGSYRAKSVYVHFDGYPSHMLYEILFNFDIWHLAFLFKHGSCSSITTVKEDDEPAFYISNHDLMTFRGFCFDFYKEPYDITKEITTSLTELPKIADNHGVEYHYTILLDDRKFPIADDFSNFNPDNKNLEKIKFKIYYRKVIDGLDLEFALDIMNSFNQLESEEYRNENRE